MSKANSHGKSTVNGSVHNTSATTKHHRRQRKNSHGGATDVAADAVGGAVGDRSTVRDYAPTAASHSQATTGARRDQPPPVPSRVCYENTYRIEPQVRRYWTA